MKKRAVVVCPGRGSYTKETLGYLKQNGRHVSEFLAGLDQRRRNLGEVTISELDQDSVFKPNLHTRGENASTLIYACAYADFMAIDRDRYDIVAVTGNSMGWYLALAFAGALDEADGFTVVNTMGSMMKEQIIGGQVIYPICDEQWRPSNKRFSAVDSVARSIRQRPGHEVYPSIYLGGFVVLGGNKAGVAALLKELPPVENYPFQLINHGAFHTPLLNETSARAFETISSSLFHKPTLPLIDGRGHIWQPYSTWSEQLYGYTLGHQVTQAYDFTQAISVSLKEFAPDALILLGPGSSLGGSLGQILCELNWKGLTHKQSFMDLQTRDPFVLSMGRPEQRSLVAKT